VRFVHAKHLAAFRANPFLIFVGHERGYAVFLYLHQVIENTNAITGYIPFFEAAQVGTREFITSKTVFKASFYQPSAVFNRASSTGL